MSQVQRNDMAPLLKYFNQTRTAALQYIYHQQVYIALARARELQNPSLCTGVKGKKWQAICVTAGQGTVTKQH